MPELRRLVKRPSKWRPALDLGSVKLGICGEQCGTKRDLFPVSPCQCHSTNASYASYSEHWSCQNDRVAQARNLNLLEIGSVLENTRVGTLIVATIYLQLIQNRYMFRSFTVLQCSHQHCVQPIARDVEVVGYL